MFFPKFLSVSTFFLASFSAAAAYDSISWPGGKATEIKSPNGMYAVKNVYQVVGGVNIPRNKYQDKSEEDRYHLFFLHTGQKERLAFYSYNRAVKILWAPDSRSFIVNDWVGSNLTVSSLYRVIDLAHPVDIGEKLRSKIEDKKDRQIISSCDPAYILVTRWINSRSVNVEFKGRYFLRSQDCREFNSDYKWDLKDSFKRTKRR